MGLPHQFLVSGAESVGLPTGSADDARVSAHADDQRLAERVARSEEIARRDTERSIQRTRLVAWVVLLVQTAIYDGGSRVVGAGSVALLAAVALATEVALRAESRCQRITDLGSLGRLCMAGDTLVVVVILFNLRTDPNDPIQLLPIVLVVEAATRWGYLGGVLGGLGGGLLAAGWAVSVHRRLELDLPLPFLSFRVAILTLVGVMVGNTVREARVQRRTATAVISASRDLVATFGLDGTLLTVNPASEAVLGYSPDELVGGGNARLDLPADALEDTHGGSGRLVELRAVRRDGRPVWIELDLIPDRRAGVIHAIGRDVSTRRRAESELRHRVDHDPLTGLCNRDAMLVYVSRMLDRGFLPALVFVDLDDFKGVNDSYGHVAGDLVLTEVAARLCGAIGLEGSVARYAGDEFCLVVDDPVEVHAVAARARESLQQPFVLAGDVLSLSATQGVAVGCEGDSAETLVDRADQAMYAGKTLRRAR